MLSPIQISQAQTIELYAEDAYTPFSNANGSGMINNLVITAYREVGVEVRIKVIPFARIVKWLESGQGLGGFSAVKTPISQQNLLFGKEPVYHVVTKFFYATARPVEIENDSDFNNPNLDVGQVNGYMYHPAFYQYQFKRHVVQSDESLIKMLLLGRLDMAYITDKVVDCHLSKMGIPRSTLSAQKQFGVISVPLYVAFNKRHPNAQYYADLLDKGLKRLKLNGKYEKLIVIK